MRRTINNVISVAVSAIRFLVLKLFHFKGLRCHAIQRFSPNVVLEMNSGSKVTLGKQVRVHSGSKIKVRKAASLTIEKNAKFNYNCIIACHDSITIGEGTEFGPSVYVYDHDHDFRAGLKNKTYKTAPVVIGKNCWIGANTIILRGTVLGDNCVVGAGSVIRGIFPENSVIVQKREQTVTSFDA